VRDQGRETEKGTLRRGYGKNKNQLAAKFQDPGQPTESLPTNSGEGKGRDEVTPHHEKGGASRIGCSEGEGGQGSVLNMNL